MWMMIQSYGPMLQREHPPNIPCVELDDTLIPSDIASVADSQILMSLILNIYVKERKFGNVSHIIYLAPTKLHVPLDPSKFQFALPYSSIRNSRAKNTMIFGMRLVIPFSIP